MQKTQNIQKKQLNFKNLALMIIGLSIIWILCISAQNELPRRLEQQNMFRIGTTGITDQKLQISAIIKQTKSKQLKGNAVRKLNELLKKNYKQSDRQIPICVLVRDFDNSLKDAEANLLTISSIQNQNYQNFQIIYLSPQNDSSIPGIKDYLKQVHFKESKISFVSTTVDSIASIFLVSEKCDTDAIIYIIQNGEALITTQVFKIISSVFEFEKLEVMWANTLYNNQQLGYSMNYPQAAFTNKTLRKYPFIANEVTAFKNHLFISNIPNFKDHKLPQPLWLPESYMLAFIQTGSKSKYIPQILTYKNTNFIPRANRPPLEIELAQLIRKNQSIIPVLQRINKKPDPV